MEHSKSSVTNAHALLPPPSSHQLQQPQQQRCDCPDSFAASSGGGSSHVQPQQQQQDKRRRKNADATEDVEEAIHYNAKKEDDVDWEGLALQQQEYIKSMKKREKRQQKQEQEQQYQQDNTAQPPKQFITQPPILEQDEEHQHPNQNHDTTPNTKNLRHGNTVPTPMERWDALLPEDSPQLSQHKLETQFIAAPVIGMDKVITTQQQQQQQGTTATGNDNNNNNDMDHRYTFSTDPNTNTNQRTRYFIPRMEYVNRTEFMESPLGQQLGVPVDPNTPKDNDRVLFLYSEGNAYPTGVTNNPFQLHTNPQQAQQYQQQRSQLEDAQGNIPVDVATENCDLVHVVLTNPDRHKQCIAIVGQYESYHVHRYMRMPPPIIQPNGVPKPQPLNASFPLRSVQRGMQVGGRPSQNTPRTNFITKNWELLLKYKTNLTAILQQQLQPLLQSITNNNTDDDKDSSTVIVMVCNFGQSELLMNFICNARAKGFDSILSKIILFATDVETYDLASSLGITSFYSKEIFEEMPKVAAKEYADDIFRLLMFAKVWCVHMVSQLGYNFLFQDVDVIWYKNPLQWFHNKENPNYHFDMFFQDDGSRALFYAPYAANTGFYYVRNNERTRYFFHSLLMSGDLIMSTYSHQIALNALLSEHISLYGLSVKILHRQDSEFPGGYAYHEKHDMMKEFLSLPSSLLSSSSSSSLSKDGTKNNGTQSIPTKDIMLPVPQNLLPERHPYIFHFCWTNNKDNKVRFMQQMGEWYLKESCKSVSKNDILVYHNNTGSMKTAGGGGGSSSESIIQHCCSARPLLKCHFKDKPSVVPCRDSPSLDDNKNSFWL